ncbi:MAG TPA: heavy-metal-associated domain-containing protein [Acidimicrobiales bacterium]|nr:heavy-metal-associated domain-containing protein [Acidimicrobiales bacterium]
MTQRIYDVPAMTCGHCKSSIETEVGGLADVATVEVDLEAKKVTVVGEAADEAIRAAIDDAGFDVAGMTVAG